MRATRGDDQSKAGRGLALCRRLLLVACSAALIAVFGISPTERASAANCSVVYVGPQAGFWSDRDNWDPKQVPSAGESVCISTTAVILDKAADVDSLTMNGGGTLEMRAPLSLSGSTDSTISGRGVSIVAGTPAHPTRLTVNGKLVLASSRIDVFAGNFLTNFGTIETKGQTSLNAHGNGTFENEGTFEVNGRSQLNLRYDNGRTIRVKRSSKLTVRGDTAGSSADDIAEQILVEGPTLPTPRAPGEPGGVLEFAGGRQSLASVSGAGTARFMGGQVSVAGRYGVATTIVGEGGLGGVVNFDAAASSSRVVQAGGEIGGKGTLTVNEALAWSAGRQTGKGETIVARRGALTIEGDEPKSLLGGRRLRNDGTGTFTHPAQAAGEWVIGGSDGKGGVFRNAGSFSFLASGKVTSGLGGHIRNSGVIRLSADGQTSLPAVVNTGTAVVERGELHLGGPYKNAARAANQSGPAGRATLSLRKGTKLKTADGLEALTNAGVVRLGRESTLMANGTYTQESGGITTLGATSTKLKAKGSPIRNHRGTLRGVGVIDGSIVNTGAVQPGIPPRTPTGRLTVTETYTQTDGGRLEVDVEGRVSGSGFDQLRVRGTAALGGTLQVATRAGFRPGSLRFKIVRAGARSGRFATLVATTPPKYQDSYDAANVLIHNPCGALEELRPASLTDFVDYVRCAETRFPGRSPRSMLSLLRQFYFGAEPWSITDRDIWKAAIPCGEVMSNPRPILGSDLSDTLERSQVVQNTDVGHIFTGLEAMACPRAEVDVHTMLGVDVWDVEMPNTEFATWGGDIGSAVAQKVLDERNRTPRPFSFYIGGPSGVASATDLNGDIDAFALRNGLQAGSLASGSEAPIVVTQRVSEMLHEYFSALATPIGAERDRRYRCFVQMLGGVINGTSITNSAELRARFKTRIEEFAFAFFVDKLTEPPHNLRIDRALAAAFFHQGVLLARAEEAMGVFLAFLEQRL